jgi:hypothetical protein
MWHARPADSIARPVRGQAETIEDHQHERAIGIAQDIFLLFPASSAALHDGLPC